MKIRKRLLMVDDDPDMGEFVRAVAEPLGYSVETYTVAVEFMAAMTNDDADVIIVDVNMPKTDGIEMLTLLASRGTRAKLYIMSGFDPGLRLAAFKLGEAHGLNMSGIIPKPVRANAIREMLA